jgi:hypothetical protein
MGTFGVNSRHHPDDGVALALPDPRHGNLRFRRAGVGLFREMHKYFYGRFLDPTLTGPKRPAACEGTAHATT